MPRISHGEGVRARSMEEEHEIPSSNGKTQPLFWLYAHSAVADEADGRSFLRKAPNGDDDLTGASGTGDALLGKAPSNIPGVGGAGSQPSNGTPPKGTDENASAGAGGIPPDSPVEALEPGPIGGLNNEAPEKQSTEDSGPTVENVTAESQVVAVGSTTILLCVASSSESDTLQYTWSVGDAEPISGGDSFVFEAGTQTGDVEIACAVRDSAGLEDRGLATVQVVPPLSFTSDPAFVGNDNSLAPLVGVLTFETNLPSTGTALVSGGGESWTIDLGPTSTLHEKSVLGLRPDTSYRVTITLPYASEDLSSAPLEWRTPALPADFPRLDLVQSNPSRMEPGMTLFTVLGPKYLIVVDQLGQVRWFYVCPRAIDGHQVFSNGNLFFIKPRSEVVEIDWRGNTIASWHAADSPVTIDAPEASTTAENFSMSCALCEEGAWRTPRMAIWKSGCSAILLESQAI